MLVETDASTSGLRSKHKGALLTPLRRLLGETGPHPPWDDSAPIRAELFSVERLEEHARSLAAVTIPGEENPLPAAAIADAARSVGITATEAPSIESALRRIAAGGPRGRVLICGSLHFAGVVLRSNG